MAAPAGQKPLPFQIPNSNAPICTVEDGHLGFLTPPWRYFFGAFSQLPVAPTVVTSAVRLQRAIVDSGNLPLLAKDSILNVSAVTDLNISVLAAASRAGAPFTFKVLPGAHSQTLKRSSTDTFDGSTSIVVTAGSSITLVPYNDGVNSGYAIE